jgi:hypothetical protein
MHCILPWSPDPLQITHVMHQIMDTHSQPGVPAMQALHPETFQNAFITSRVTSTPWYRVGVPALATCPSSSRTAAAPTAREHRSSSNNMLYVYTWLLCARLRGHNFGHPQRTEYSQCCPGQAEGDIPFTRSAPDAPWPESHPGGGAHPHPPCMGRQATTKLSRGNTPDSAECSATICIHSPTPLMQPRVTPLLGAAAH